MPYKPERYPAVAPYLIVDGAARTVDFLVDVFGAERLRRIDDGDRVKHAEVRIDDTVVMIADSLPGWPAIASNVHVYVADVDATWRRALAAGASVVQEPAQRDVDDDRRGGFTEPGGTTWWIATQVDAARGAAS